MFTKLLVIILFITSLNIYANNPTLPQVESPIPALQEGVDVKLTQEQIKRILPWTKNAKDSLERVLFSIEGKNKRDKNRGLVRGIKRAVIDSYPKNSGLLMRYVLNRGLAIHKILMERSDNRVIGAIDMRNRVLEASIKLALKYWQNDLALLKAKTPTVHDRTKFAVSYSKFLSHISKSIMSAQAQYTITKLNLGFLSWDLYNDEKMRMKMSSAILDLHTELRDLVPNGYKNDQRALQKVRHMKKIRARAIKKIERKIGIIKTPVKGQVAGTPSDDATLGVKFVTIKAGTFTMGSPYSEKGRYSDEKAHKVTITRDFEMMTTEVTQKMWKKIMGDNPSHFKGDNLPVETVSWDDAKKFIASLNKKQSRYTYRLPTEAEWEYAARGGTKTAYSFGNNASELTKYAWYDKNSGSKTHPVGQKLPNPYGLYDMYGNVWELTEDWYEKSPSGGSDPKGATSGAYRVIRGGGWNYGSGYARSVDRGYWLPTDRGNDVGLRLVRTVRTP